MFSSYISWTEYKCHLLEAFLFINAAVRTFSIMSVGWCLVLPLVIETGGSDNTAVLGRNAWHHPYYVLEKYTVCKLYTRVLTQTESFCHSTSASHSGPSTKLGQYTGFKIITMSPFHCAETLTDTKSCHMWYVHVKWYKTVIYTCTISTYGKGKALQKKWENVFGTVLKLKLNLKSTQERPWHK